MYCGRVSWQDGDTVFLSRSCIHGPRRVRTSTLCATIINSRGPAILPGLQLSPALLTRL